MFLKLKRVQKSFSGNAEIKALKPISLRLKKGSHLFVIGETGSGKSTLLKCLVGQYDLEGGQIELEGIAIGGPSQNLIPGHEDIRLVEQEFALKKFNTVYQNLEMVLDAGLLKKDKALRIKTMLDLFGLHRLKQKLPTQLSGGQQQRLALAVALIDLPKLLLLDEPFAHFDPQLKSRIFEYLRTQIVEQQITIVTVTHDYRETLKHATEVLILNKGKKVQLDSPQNCYHFPKDIYSAGLLSEFNLLEFQDATYMVRPEEISIVNKKEMFKAMVVNKEFGGHHSELLVQLQNGSSLLLYAANTKNIEVGDSVGLAIENLNRKVNESERIEYLD